MSAIAKQAFSVFGSIWSALPAEASTRDRNPSNWPFSTSPPYGATNRLSRRAKPPLDLIIATDRGLYCPAGDFHIDPWRPVSRAIITHAHSDHARFGSDIYVCHHDT